MTGQKEEKIRFYLQRNKDIPEQERISQAEISRLVEVTPKYVTEIKQKMEREAIVVSDSGLESKVKGEAERTIKVIRDINIETVAIKNDLIRRANEKRESGADARDLKPIVESLVLLSRELRANLRFLHEIRGDFSDKKQGNVIVFYNNLFSEFKAVLFQLIDDLPPDIRIKFLDLLDITLKKMAGNPETAPKKDSRKTVDVDYKDITEGEKDANPKA